LKRPRQNRPPIYSDKAFEKKLLTLFVAQNLPYRLVEEQEFRDLVEFLNPTAQAPTRHRLRDVLDETYDESQQKLFPCLGKDTKVSLAVDCWKSPNDIHFLGILCYYISDSWEYREVLLGFELLSSSHTRENLAQIIEDVLAEHNLAHRLFAVTADNASNNDTMRQHLESSFSSQGVVWNANMMRINCLAHVLNLSVKAFLKALDVDDAADEADDGSESESEDTRVTLPIGSSVSTTVAKVSLSVQILKFLL
jgi:hypothetical protein